MHKKQMTPISCHGNRRVASSRCFQLIMMMTAIRSTTQHIHNVPAFINRDNERRRCYIALQSEGAICVKTRAAQQFIYILLGTTEPLFSNQRCLVTPFLEYPMGGQEGKLLHVFVKRDTPV